MADDIEIGSKIITIAVMMHGVVIETELSAEKQYIFNNTRLFSLAGDFSQVGLGEKILRVNHLNTLNRVFRKVLPQSTSAVMENFAENARRKYTLYIESFFKDLSTENICQIFETISFDKALGSCMPKDIYSRIMQCISPDIVGIYVISVHKKINTSTLELIYPLAQDAPNLDLLNPTDFIEFAGIFDKDGESILNDIHAKSSPWPNYNMSIDDETYKAQIDEWNITFSPGGFLNPYGDISHIRLSYLVDIIKQIVDPENPNKCKINIFDYSCSGKAPIASYKPKKVLKKVINTTKYKAARVKSKGTQKQKPKPKKEEK
jgi:hypothetical protein